MKVACVLITHLRAKAEMQRRPHLKGQPVVIVDRGRSGAVVVDHFPAAAAVADGIPLEQALSRRAGAVALDADEPHYRRVFRQVLNALQGVAGRVEDAGLGVACVDLAGLEAMHGGEERLVCNLLNAVPQHLQPRVGVSDGKFPALVAARASEPLRAVRVPADAAAFLSSCSVGHLPVSGATLEALRRFGLHTLGQVAAMEQGRMVDRFGPEGAWAWSLAHGHDGRPLILLKHEEEVTEQTALPFAATSLELLLLAADTLLQRAYARPVMRGRHAGRADLECPVFGAGPWQKTVNFQEGVGRWERASFIVRSRLEAEPPGVPVDGLALTLSGFTGETGAQLGLLPEARDSRRERLAEAERRLQARRGGGPALYRVAQVAPWHPAPEMRAVQTPLDALSGGIRPLLAPESVTVEEDENRQPKAVRLSGEWQRVARVEESWCFDLWWLPNPVTRVYYRVEREDGGRVTLFRDQHDGGWFRQGR